MSKNNLEDQTNAPILLPEQFRAQHEPYLTDLINQGEFIPALKHFVELLTNFRMEPELRQECLFGIAACQYHHALAFQQEELERGKNLASLVGMTQLEKETTKAMLIEYIAGLGTAVTGETENGQAE